MHHPIRTVKIRNEPDLVHLRQIARQISRFLGFAKQDQIRIATSVSEIGRNAIKYGSNGSVEFALTLGDQSTFSICVSDKGKGIKDLRSVLEGTYCFESTLGLGIVSAQRLMDEFTIENRPEGGTQVRMQKYLPREGNWNEIKVAELAREVLALQPDDPYQELQTQHQELVRTLEELHGKQSQLFQLNQELEDTNRGVLALYSELDEKSKLIQRNSESKNRFLSNISHELRTPVISIVSLARMLLEKTDGELSPEQEKQVNFILGAATSLQEMVNDLLDLAKTSAGKINLKISTFDMEQVFQALRGMMRPLLADNNLVTIVFEKDPDLPPLQTDEGKVSQILRNFISNAIKFTEQGEIRVTADREDEETLRISVKDTGLGIDPKFHGMIFEEFEQIESPLQTKHKGTGLGLPLSRKLAELLGGTVYLKSALGEGSEFSVVVPIRYGREGILGNEPLSTPRAIPRVLVIDDDEISRYLLRDALRHTGIQLFEANGGSSGIQQAKELQPDAILLDLIMPQVNGFDVLQALRGDPETSQIPIIINSTKSLDEKESSFLSGKVASIIPKNFSSRENATTTVRNAICLALGMREVSHG